MHVKGIRRISIDDDEVVATFREKPLAPGAIRGEGAELRAIFRRGPDRLFRFEKVERLT